MVETKVAGIIGRIDATAESLSPTEYKKYLEDIIQHLKFRLDCVNEERDNTD